MDLRFRRTTADRLQVKGNLSEDGTYITYNGENGTEQRTTISDLLSSFDGNLVEITLIVKSEEELYVPATEEPGTVTPTGPDDDGDGTTKEEPGIVIPDDGGDDGDPDDDGGDGDGDDGDTKTAPGPDETNPDDDDDGDDDGDSSVPVGGDSGITLDD